MIEDTPPNIRTILKNIDGLINSGFNQDALDQIDSLLEMPKWASFYPFTGQLYYLRSKAHFNKKDVKSWAYDCFIFLSKNYIKYLPSSYYDSWLTEVKSLDQQKIEISGKAPPPLIIQTSFSKNKSFEKAKVNALIQSNLPKQITVSSLSILVEQSLADKSQKETQEILIKENISLEPGESSVLKQFIDFKGMYTVLTICQVLVKIEKVTFILQPFGEFLTLNRIKDSSNCITKIDTPPFGIVDVRVPLKITMTSPPNENVEFIYKLSAEPDKRRKYSVSKGQTLTKTDYVQFSTPSQQDIRVRWTNLIDGIPTDPQFTNVSLKFLKPFSVRFKKEGEDNVATVYVTITHLLSIPVTITSITSDVKDCEVVGWSDPIVLSKGEKLKTALFYPPQQGRLIINYTASQYFEGPLQYKHNLPDYHPTNKKVNVKVTVPKIGSHFLPVWVTVNVRNDGDVPETCLIKLQPSADAVAHGYLKRTVLINPKDEYEFETLFFPKNIGPITMGMLTVSCGPIKVFEKEIGMFVTFSSK